MSQSIDREHQRQQALMAALLARDGDAALAPWLSTPPAQRERGLQAYRANAGASAERTLASSFPTVQRLVGEESFAALARALWQARPPQRGDLACFGDELPAFIALSEQLADVPYLADVARLDWRVSEAERAADEPTELDSLNLLATVDPAELSLLLAPGMAVLRSAHPVFSVWRAHRAGPNEAECREQARQALAESRAETVLVWRQGWRGLAEAIDDAGGRWVEALLRGDSLSQALQAAGDSFAFEPWLMQALSQGWLRGAQRCAAQ